VSHVLPPLPFVADATRKGGGAAAVALIVLPGAVVAVVVGAGVHALAMP